MKSRKTIIAEKIIATATAMGSTASTVKGAHRYIMGHSWPALPKRGMRAYRGRLVAEQYRATHRAAARLDYEISQAHAAGKLHPTEIAARNAKRDASKVARVKANLAANWPLRHSGSSWAGGNHNITVKISDTPHANGGSIRVWSSNGKWSGTNSYANLGFTRRALRHFPTGQAMDGAIVLDAEKIAPREYKIIYVRQGRGFELVASNGWMIRGYLSTSTSLDAARKQAKAARLQAAKLAASSRFDTARLRTIWVSYEDSIAAGNCAAMTEQVRAKIVAKYGQVGGIRADALVEMRDDIYVRRAIAKAAGRIAA